MAFWMQMLPGFGMPPMPILPPPPLECCQELKEFGSWSEQTSSAGRKYYYNSSTEISQWEKPREWKEAELKLEKERIEQKIQASRAHASSSSSGPNGAPPSSEASSAPPPPPPPPMGFMNMPPPPFLPPPFGAPPPPFGAPPPPFGGQFSSMPPPIPPPMGAFFPPPMFQPPPPPPAALLPKAVPPPAAMTSFQSTAVPPPPVGPRTLATTITTSAATTTSAAMMMMPSHVNNCNGPPPPPPPGHHQQPGPMSSAPPSTMSQPFQSQLGHGPSREQRERDAQGPSPVHLTRNSRDHEMGGNASRRTPQPISNSERRSSTASYIKREMSSGTPTPRGDHNDMANPNVANGDRDYFDEPRDRKRSHVTATPTPTLTPTTAMTTHPLARNSGDSVAKKMCGRQDDAGTNGTPFGNSAGKVTSLGSALTDANTTHLTSKGQLPVAVHDIKTECRSENAPMDQDDKWRPKSRCKSDSPLERKPFLPLMKRNPEVWADMMRFYDQRLAEEKARELGLNDELDRRELMKCRMQELKMEAELAQELDSMCSASNVAAVQSFESRLLLVKLNGLRKTMEAMCENLSERMDIGQAMTSTSTTTTTTTMTTTSTTTLPAGTTAT